MQPVSICLINVILTSETTHSRTFFTWSYAALLTLQHDRILGMELFIGYYKHRVSSCKSRTHIPDINLIYRTDFLFENITQLIAQ